MSNYKGNILFGISFICKVVFKFVIYRIITYDWVEEKKCLLFINFIFCVIIENNLDLFVNLAFHATVFNLALGKISDRSEYYKLFGCGGGPAHANN